MRLALYQPDIPQNLGTLIRLGACLGVPVHVIEPCGFPLGDRDLKRAAMDYAALAQTRRHVSWAAFQSDRTADAPAGEQGGKSTIGRLVLLTTRADLPYTAFQFRPDDTLLVGRESAGVPDEVHDAADARLIVPMQAGARSLNVAVTAAMVLGEALRRTGGFPAPVRQAGRE